MLDELVGGEIPLTAQGKAELDEKMRMDAQFRVKRKDPFFHLAGEEDTASWRTIWASPGQRKVVLVGVVYYAFGALLYLVMANVLIRITFQGIPPESLSFPGNVTDSQSLESILKQYYDHTNLVYRRELYDLGFMLTPNYSHRPPAMKFFVDIIAAFGQLAPLLLLFLGRTGKFVKFCGVLACMQAGKATMQTATILPPANRGEYCWNVNFTPDELQMIQHEPFSKWMFKPWGVSHGCNDMIWSGHTAQSALGFLFLNHELRRIYVPPFVRALLAVIFLVYIWVLITLRMHYSIDILCAVLVACLFKTHSPFRYSIWYASNKLAGNSPGS